MWSWLSTVNVNAVFAAVLAIIAYLHNHSFRVAQASKGPSVSQAEAGARSAPVLLVLMVLALAGFVSLGALGSCGSSSPRTKAVVAAEVACVAQVAVLAARLKAASPQEDGGAIALQVFPDELACAIAAFALPSAVEASK